MDAVDAVERTVGAALRGGLASALFPLFGGGAATEGRPYGSFDRINLCNAP